MIDVSSKEAALSNMASAKQEVQIAFQYDLFTGYLSHKNTEIWFFETECPLMDLSFKIDPDMIRKVTLKWSGPVLLHHKVEFEEVGLPFH